ncbi:MAG: hypothetical protein JJ974_00070 [Phycisphaerales bacterium]|nr:hypothetical protein [Phycisphaerales bacterium]
MDDQMNDQSNELDMRNSAHMRDLLISRVIDGSATPEDWSSFRILAANDAEVWTDLSDAQREHEALSEVMHMASSIADGVELPGGSGSPLVFESRVTTTARWGGWAIAAVLLLGWFTGTISMNTSNGLNRGTGGPATAGMIPLRQADTDQAFDQYLQAGQNSGKVVGEMPNQIVVETKPLENGTIEVIYLRQIVERRVLEKAYRETVDEFGKPAVVPVDLDSIKHKRSQ